MSTQPLLQRTANKRIALPVRVEPKVAFANERTFLSWLHFTVVLGGLAVGLLNFGDKIGRISAGMFSIVGMFLSFFLVVVRLSWRAVAYRKWPNIDLLYLNLAMAVMIYALYTYHWRAASIRRGGKGPYDDRLGPVSRRTAKTLS